MNDLERQQKLLTLAEKDEVYQLWNHCYAESQADFEKFANAQSKDVQKLMWCYAESGRLLYQRLTNLACTYMTFPEEHST